MYVVCLIYIETQTSTKLMFYMQLLFLSKPRNFLDVIALSQKIVSGISAQASFSVYNHEYRIDLFIQL